MDKKITHLEKALENMRKSHNSCWDVFGSELCVGDLIRQEEKLEKEIEKLRKEYSSFQEDPKHIIDD